jgi:hypothetical protein
VDGSGVFQERQHNATHPAEAPVRFATTSKGNHHPPLHDALRTGVYAKQRDTNMLIGLSFRPKLLPLNWT